MINKDDIEQLEIQRRRGLILQNLKTKYPEGVDFEVLRKALELQGHSLTKKELSILVQYLKDGEYVKVIFFRHYILVVALSKRGIDLLDGLITDSGIMV